MNRQLPADASLEHLKSQAKRLLQGYRQRDPEAARRIREVIPTYRQSSDPEILDAGLRLQQMQFVLAREYGFSSWVQLRRRLDPGPALPTWKLLRQAIDANKVQRVRELVELEPELLTQPLHEGGDGYFNQKHTALPYAAQGGRVEVVRWLAAQYPQLAHLADARGLTPVNTLGHTMATACAGLTPPRLEIYEFLKSLGAKPDLANAARAGDLATVQEWLRQDPARALERQPVPTGVERRLADENALVIAADAGHGEIVAHLLELGVRDPEHLYNAFSRAILSNHWSVIHQLSPFMSRDQFSTALLGCCEFLNLDGARYLLAQGADPNYRRGDGHGPLAAALTTYSRKPWRGAFLDMLVEAGAEGMESTPRMAIERSRPDLLAAFLDADPGLVHRQFDDMEFPGKRDLKGGTLLHIAAEFYEADCAELLLARGADINALAAVDSAGIGGHTAIFHLAASYKHFGLPLLKSFLAKGADLSVEAHLCCTRLGCAPPEGPCQVTPLGWARWHDYEWPMGGNREAIDLLRAAGAPEGQFKPTH